MLLRGIPLQAGSGKVYSGFVYAEIRDPHTQDRLAARVPEQLAGGLEWGREAVLVGLIHYPVRRGELRPEFRVDDVREAGDLRLPTKDDLLRRWSVAVARPLRDVRAALLKEKPRLVLVTGMGSVAADDVQDQLRERDADLTLIVVRVSMHEPGEVVQVVRGRCSASATEGRSSNAWPGPTPSRRPSPRSAAAAPSCPRRTR